MNTTHDVTHDRLEALIIVDVQNDFCPGGSLAVERGDIVAYAIKNHLERLRSTGQDYDVVVTTQDWHIAPGKHWADEPDYIDTWPVHCAAESKGAELHDFIKEIEDKFVDEKFFKGQYAAAYSGFEAVNKDGVLLGPWLHQKADELGYEEINTTVVGLAYDYCVKATAIDAAHEKMNPQVVYSLTAPVHGDGWYSDHSKEMIREGVIIHAVNS